MNMPRRDVPILVTGASGHVGANLTHRLVEEGRNVRVLLREGETNEAVQGLDVEVAYGDLRAPETLKPALKDVGAVFHVASMVSTIDGNADHRREIYETNVVGTKHLLRLAKEAEVGRFILTSSFSAVGYDLDQTDRPADESVGFYPFHRAMPYERTKVLQEHELLKAAVEGMDALIVTSTAVIGGHDYLPSRMGRTMCRFANRDLRAYVPGGFVFVGTRDLVDGHIKALERGRTGQKYVIGTQFLTLDDIWKILTKVTGQPAPKFRIPSEVLLPIAEVTSFALSRLAPKRTQLLTPGAIRRLKLRRHADLSKAINELGYEPGSIEDAFAEAYAFHHARGAITHPDAKAPTFTPRPMGVPSQDAQTIYA